MYVYISILRGINVGSSNAIKMDELRKAYVDLGFGNTTTYVQSGNVIFHSDETDVKKLKKKISQQIEIVFGLFVPVIILKKETLRLIIENNPLTKNSNNNPDYLHVTFLSDKPEKYDPKIIESKKQQGEEIAFSETAVYLYCPNGYGRTRLNNGFIESKLKVTATTRNWKTTNELYNIAHKISLMS